MGRGPSWGWGEAPKFPDFIERRSWAAKFERLRAEECQAIVGGGPIVVENRKGVFSRYPKKESGSWGRVRPRRNTPMREGTQCFGRMEGLLGPDRLSEALRGKI